MPARTYNLIVDDEQPRVVRTVDSLLHKDWLRLPGFGLGGKSVVSLGRENE